MSERGDVVDRVGCSTLYGWTAIAGRKGLLGCVIGYVVVCVLVPSVDSERSEDPSKESLSMSMSLLSHESTLR